MTDYPKPPFPKQAQAVPGSQRKMDPVPDCGEQSYKGSGRLQGKIALITGADSGIGRAVAIAFAREGADVAVAYLNEHEDAKETENRLQSMEAALAQLPPAQRRCLELFYLEKKCYRDIATETGLELNLVRSHLQNGKRMLRRQLEPPAPPTSRSSLPASSNNNPLHVAR